VTIVAVKKQYVLHIYLCVRTCARAFVSACVDRYGCTGTGVFLCACSLTNPACSTSI
jgi:hypothetical protein